MMNKSVKFSVLTVIVLLVTMLIVMLRSATDTSDIATVKRLISKGVEIYSFYNDPNDPQPDDPLFDSPPYTKLTLKNVTEESIRGISGITLCPTSISEKDIQFLGTLPNLKGINIVSGSLSDSLADEIGQNLNSISDFWIGEVPLSPGVWRGLGKLNNVSVLILSGTIISDESFEDGTEMSPISIIISDVQISEIGLIKLIKTDKLETIALGNTNISDNITSFFDECPKLNGISITESKIQCLFVAEMQHTDKLQSLYLRDTSIDNGIIASAVRFQNLESLTVWNTNVTESSIPLLETLAKRLDRIILREDSVDLFKHRKSTIDPQLREEILSNPLVPGIKKLVDEEHQITVPTELR